MPLSALDELRKGQWLCDLWGLEFVHWILRTLQKLPVLMSLCCNVLCSAIYFVNHTLLASSYTGAQDFQIWPRGDFDLFILRGNHCELFLAFLYSD